MKTNENTLLVQKTAKEKYGVVSQRFKIFSLEIRTSLCGFLIRMDLAQKQNLIFINHYKY
jgi:hypothetical protein